MVKRAPSNAPAAVYFCARMVAVAPLSMSQVTRKPLPSLAIVGFTSATPAVAATVSAVPPPGNDIGVVAPGATMLAPMPVSEELKLIDSQATANPPPGNAVTTGMASAGLPDGETAKA